MVQLISSAFYYVRELEDSNHNARHSALSSLMQTIAVLSPTSILRKLRFENQMLVEKNGSVHKKQRDSGGIRTHATEVTGA